MVVASAGRVACTPGSGIVSSAADVLGMSVMCGMRGVGVVCEMCICLARGGVGGDRGKKMILFGLSFTNPVGTGEFWKYVCDWVAVVWVV